MLPADTQDSQAAVAEMDPLHVLLDSSALLLSSNGQEQVLSGILDIASRILAADAYAVWREAREEGRWEAIAARGLSDTYPAVTEGAARPTGVWAVPDIAAEPALAHRLPAYASEGIRSMLVVPLSLANDRRGTITFYWHAPHTFTERDHVYAEALGNLCASALKHSALKEQNEREQHRLSFLAEASVILASSLDYETTLQQVAKLIVPEIADWCVVHVMEHGQPTRLVTAHRDPEMVSRATDLLSRYPEEIREDRGLGWVLATGKTQLLREITPTLIASEARDAEHRRLLESLQITSSILVPMVSHDHVLGAIRLVAAGARNRQFTDADVRLAEDIARRAASAIENAELHRAVLQKESQLRLSHAAARMGSWHMDLQHQKFSWSEEFRRLHGLSADQQATYNSGADLVHPDDRERVLGELNAALQSESEQLDVDHRAVTPDGRTLWLQSRGTILRDSNGQAIAITGITLDVTESRAAEDALRRTEKLAAAGRLAATVAHEVNNPLEALTNLIFLANNSEGVPQEARKFLSMAESELERIAHIVRQTLGFYRDSSTPQAVDVGQVVADVTELYRSRAESRRIALSHSAADNVHALANTGELKQILANLVSNALDATPPNGAVETRVERRGGSIEVVVQDNGTGIAEEHRARLFEPFFTTKDEVGTGLGLWVTKGLVEKHHGTLRVESSTQPGHTGTKVTICLPPFSGSSEPLSKAEFRHDE